MCAGDSNRHGGDEHRHALGRIRRGGGDHQRGQSDDGADGGYRQPGAGPEPEHHGTGHVQRERSDDDRRRHRRRQDQRPPDDSAGPGGDIGQHVPDAFAVIALPVTHHPVGHRAHTGLEERGKDHRDQQLQRLTPDPRRGVASGDHRGGEPGEHAVDAVASAHGVGDASRNAAAA
jgi:hypothetical protein